MSRISKLMGVAAITLGLAAGLGAFTFGYARGYSYLTNNPSACANCHAMSEHFYAPQEAARVLAHALEHARRGQRILAGQSDAPISRIGAPRTEH